MARGSGQRIKITINVEGEDAVKEFGKVSKAVEDFENRTKRATKTLDKFNTSMAALRTVMGGFRTIFAAISTLVQVLGGIIRTLLVPVTLALVAAWKTLKLALQAVVTVINTAVNVALDALRRSIKFTVIAVGVMTAALTASTVAAAKLQTGVANVIALIGNKGIRLFREFSVGIRSIASQTGQASSALTKALFDIVSAGTPAAKSLTLLREAAKSAVAGVTDVATSTSAGLTIMQSFSREITGAADAFDFLFETQRRGRTTFAEISAFIGRLAPAAAAVGVRLNEMGAALSSVTRFIPNTMQATTGLVQLINELSRSTGEQAAAAQKLGVEIGVAALESKGLTGVLRDLMRLTTTQQRLIVRTVEGQRALNALMLDFGGFMEDQSEQLRRGGRRLEAFGIIASTVEESIKRLLQTLNSLGQSIGGPFLRPIVQLIDTIGGFFALGQDKQGKFTFFGAFADELERQSSRIVMSIGSVSTAISGTGGGEGLGRSLAAGVVGLVEKISVVVVKATPIVERLTKGMTKVFDLFIAFLEKVVNQIGGQIGKVSSRLESGGISRVASGAVGDVGAALGVPIISLLGRLVNQFGGGAITFAEALTRGFESILDVIQLVLKDIIRALDPLRRLALWLLRNLGALSKKLFGKQPLTPAENIALTNLSSDVARFVPGGRAGLRSRVAGGQTANFSMGGFAVGRGDTPEGRLLSQIEGLESRVGVTPSVTFGMSDIEGRVDAATNRLKYFNAKLRGIVKSGVAQFIQADKTTFLFLSNLRKFVMGIESQLKALGGDKRLREFFSLARRTGTPAGEDIFALVPQAVATREAEDRAFRNQLVSGGMESARVFSNAIESRFTLGAAGFQDLIDIPDTKLQKMIKLRKILSDTINSLTKDLPRAVGTPFEQAIGDALAKSLERFDNLSRVIFGQLVSDFSSALGKISGGLSTLGFGGGFGIVGAAIRGGKAGFNIGTGAVEFLQGLGSLGARLQQGGLDTDAARAREAFGEFGAGAAELNFGGANPAGIGRAAGGILSALGGLGKAGGTMATVMPIVGTAIAAVSAVAGFLIDRNAKKQAKDIARQQKILDRAFSGLTAGVSLVSEGFGRLASGTMLATGAVTALATAITTLPSLVDSFRSVTRRRLRLFGPTLELADLAFTGLSNALVGTGGESLGESFRRGRLPLDLLEGFREQNVSLTFSPGGEIQVGEDGPVISVAGPDADKQTRMFLTRIGEFLSEGTIPPGVTLSGMTGTLATHASALAGGDGTTTDLGGLVIQSGSYRDPSSPDAIGVPFPEAITGGTLNLPLSAIPSIFGAFTGGQEGDRVREFNSAVTDFFDTLFESIKKLKDFAAGLFTTVISEVVGLRDFLFRRTDPLIADYAKNETALSNFDSFSKNLTDILSIGDDEITVDNIKDAVENFQLMGKSIKDFASSADSALDRLEDGIRSAEEAQQELLARGLVAAEGFLDLRQVIKFTGRPTSEFASARQATLRERISGTIGLLGRADESGLPEFTGERRIALGERLSSLSQELFSFTKELPGTRGLKLQELQVETLKNLDAAQEAIGTGIYEQLDKQIELENIQRAQLKALFKVETIQEARKLIDETIETMTTKMANELPKLTRTMEKFFGINIAGLKEVSTKLVGATNALETQEKLLDQITTNIPAVATFLSTSQTTVSDLTDQINYLRESGIPLELAADATEALEAFPTSVDLDLPDEFINFGANLERRLNRVLDRVGGDTTTDEDASPIPSSQNRYLTTDYAGPNVYGIDSTLMNWGEGVDLRTVSSVDEFIDLVTGGGTHRSPPGSNLLFENVKRRLMNLEPVTFDFNSLFPGDNDMASSQHGNIFTRPNITSIAEREPEAVIPLSRLNEFVPGGGRQEISVQSTQSTPVDISLNFGGQRFQMPRQWLQQVQEFLLQQTRAGVKVVSERGIEQRVR